MPVLDFALKEILADPQGACMQRWPDASEAAQKFTAANALIASIDALKPALKQKKNEKQLCARDFNRIKSEGGDIDAQKLQMRQIADELNKLEQQVRELETELLNLFVKQQETPSRLFPSRFDDLAPKNTTAVRIAALENDEQPVWVEYVAKHPQASLYHDYRWRSVIENSFGHQCFYLVARNDHGQLCGVLPLIRLRSHLFGDFAVSLPFFNYGGPLADNSDIAHQLLNHAAVLASDHQLKHLEIRSTNLLGNWPARTDKASMIKRLPATVEQLDSEIGAKVRAQIKRARQEAVEIFIGHLDRLDNFYHVFAINMRDLGTPVYGKNFFGNILRAFPQQAHIIAIHLQGKPVAAAFLLGDRDMLEIPWASTLRSANALNINMLLYREVLGFAIDRGYNFFDFGRSTIDSGTYRFKRQWGAQPLQHYWHYWLPGAAELPNLKPDSPKFRLLISTWKRLPVAISKLIGPHIVKYLP